MAAPTSFSYTAGMVCPGRTASYIRIAMISLVITGCLGAAAHGQPDRELDTIAAETHLLAAHPEAEPITLAQLQTIIAQCAEDPCGETHLEALAAIDHTRVHLTDLPASELAADITPYRQEVRSLLNEADRAMWALSSEAAARLRIRDIDRYFLIRSAQFALLRCLYRAESPASSGVVLSLLSDVAAYIRIDVGRDVFSAKDLEGLLTTVRQCERMLYSEAELCALTDLVLTSAETPVDQDRLRRIMRRESRLAAAERDIPGDPLGIARVLSPRAPEPVDEVMPYLAASVLWKQDRLRFEIRATLVHAMAYHYRHTYSGFPADIAAVRNHFGADDAYQDPISGAEFVLWRLGDPPEDTFMLYSIGLDAVDDEGIDGGEAPLVDHQATGDYIICWRG